MGFRTRILLLKILNNWWLMLLLLILFILVSGCGVATSTLGMGLGIHYFCLGSVLWMYLEVDWQLVVELSCCDCVEIKVSRKNVAFPHWARTIIIQNLQILQHDSADTGSPWSTF